VQLFSRSILLAAFLVAAQSPVARAQQTWDTNTLVNEAHNLKEGDLDGLRQQAGGDDVHAEVILGLAYEMGAAGLMPDSVQALNWFLKAADRGIPWAEMWAADFYYTGSPGVPRDLYKAIELYRSSSEHGNPRAAFYVGRMYFFGEGVVTNHEEAAQWFKRALPADPQMVGRMVALSENGCASAFCLSLRQIVGAMTTDSAGQYAGEWDDATNEWDSVKTLPDFERCGLTSSNRTEKGDVQNYFCDTEVIEDAMVGAKAAARLADDVGSALGGGWTRTAGDRPNAYFFSRDGYPRLRITYNVTRGDAPQRVTLLVGP
jgi:hypothetical protein